MAKVVIESEFHGDEKSLVVYLSSGTEVGRYCVVDDAKQERDELQDMLDEVVHDAIGPTVLEFDDGSVTVLAEDIAAISVKRYTCPPNRDAWYSDTYLHIRGSKPRKISDSYEDARQQWLKAMGL